jgi:hypothetical protein
MAPKPQTFKLTTCNVALSRNRKLDTIDEVAKVHNIDGANQDYENPNQYKQHVFSNQTQ